MIPAAISKANLAQNLQQTYGGHECSHHPYQTLEVAILVNDNRPSH